MKVKVGVILVVFFLTMLLITPVSAEPKKSKNIRLSLGKTLTVVDLSSVNYEIKFKGIVSNSSVAGDPARAYIRVTSLHPTSEPIISEYFVPVRRGGLQLNDNLWIVIDGNSSGPIDTGLMKVNVDYIYIQIVGEFSNYL